MPIEFGYRARWIGGRVLALADILHLWEQGKWKQTCPKCGETGYLFYSKECSGKVYCPKCKEIVSVEIKDENGHRDYGHYDEADKLLEALPYKRRDIGPHGWTTRLSRAIDHRHKKTPFSSNLHSYKEVFTQSEKSGQMTQEEFTAKAQFEIAKKHGEKIATWLEKISQHQLTERKKALKQTNIKQISPVTKMLERIKDLANSDIANK